MQHTHTLVASSYISSFRSDPVHPGIRKKHSYFERKLRIGEKFVVANQKMTICFIQQICFTIWLDLLTSMFFHLRCFLQNNGFILCIGLFMIHKTTFWSGKESQIISSSISSFSCIIQGLLQKQIVCNMYAFSTKPKITLFSFHSLQIIILNHFICLQKFEYNLSSCAVLENTNFSIFSINTFCMFNFPGVRTKKKI